MDAKNRLINTDTLIVLSGCTSWRDIPDDVKFVALHSDYGPSHSNIRGEVLDIEIESNFNYIEYSQGSQSVYAEMYFCGKKEETPKSISGLSLYKNMGGWVPVHFGGHDTSPPPYRYHAAFYVSRYDTFVHGQLDHSIKSYDLRDNPVDLCLYTDISTYYHEKSNIVRIPKEYLIQFFAENPRK